MKYIQSDSRQKRNHHRAKERYFESRGYTIVNSKMLVGDYMIPSRGNVVCDTKADCGELYSNLIQDHARFHNECVLAKEAGIKLYVVIENEHGFKKPDDIRDWKNPQYYRYLKARAKAKQMGAKEPKAPASNIQLIKIMHSMTRDYGVEFIFTSKADAGKIVLELLGETGGEQ